jgi:hypothetical protein
MSGDELLPDLETAKVIDDKDLIDIEIKELNKKIKEKGLPKELAVKLKQRRRTLKNRNYATSCREKKDAEITGLEDVREKELDELNSLEEGNKRLKESVDKMKSDYALFLQFARENNIQAEMSDIQYQLSPRQRDSD